MGLIQVLLISNLCLFECYIYYFCNYFVVVYRDTICSEACEGTQVDATSCWGKWSFCYFSLQVRLPVWYFRFCAGIYMHVPSPLMKQGKLRFWSINCTLGTVLPFWTFHFNQNRSSILQKFTWILKPSIDFHIWFMDLRCSTYYCSSQFTREINE